MRREIFRKKSKEVLLTLAVLISMVGICSAATVNLKADVMTKTMPDGRVITMWGFGLQSGQVSVPGPTITVPPGDTTLTINLQNNLSEPVSIVIPGQIATMTPVKFTDSTGRQRVRSFTQETAALGSGVYTWTNLRPGTYLYYSGSHSSLQVQMGLYGVVKRDFATGQAYDGVGYDNEVVLLFSEIDPTIHDAVAAGNYGTGRTITSTINYEPKYFLINGSPFSPGLSPVSAGSPGQNILLRFLNAGYKDYVPSLYGLYMTTLAEDGNLYPYSKQEYSVLLPAGKTKDAIISPSSAGYIPVYDRRLDLTNATTSPGGMLAYLDVSSATQYTLTVARAGTGTGKVESVSLPGGIDCRTGVADCTEAYRSGTEIVLKATPDVGSAFSGWSGAATGTTATTTVTMSSAKAVTATFTSAAPLTVTSPNGGEILRRSTDQTITWTYSGDPGPYVKIQLYRGANLYMTITSKTSVGSDGTGSFVWRVPPKVVLGINYKVKVTSTANSGYTDMSNANFRIAQ